MAAKDKYDKAKELYNKVTTSTDKVTTPPASYFLNIGRALMGKRDYDEALKNYNKALDLSLNSLGDQHLNLAIIYTHIGEAWQAKGCIDKKMEFFNKASLIYKKKLGGAHPYTKYVSGELEVVEDDFEVQIFKKLSHEHPLPRVKEVRGLSVK